MTDIRIDDIRRQLEDLSIKSKVNNNDTPTGESFSSVLKSALKGVNNDQVAAGNSMMNYVSGKDTNLHTTLISLEKADISFKMMMQVRSKLLEAYQEIMRTSV